MQELFCFRMKDLPPSYVVLKKVNCTDYHVFKFYFNANTQSYNHWDYIDSDETKEISQLVAYYQRLVNDRQQENLYSIFDVVEFHELPDLIKQEVLTRV